MTSYVFTTPDQNVALRDDGAHIPWNVADNQPDIGGLIYRTWVADGSPIPTPYVKPLPKQLGDVDTFCGARLAQGYTDVATGKTWQCDDASQGKWTAIASNAGFAITMQVTPPPTFTLIAADNSTTVLSAADTFALFTQRVMPWVSATIMYARQMKDSILAGNPPADITAGWPPNTTTASARAPAPKFKKR